MWLLVLLLEEKVCLFVDFSFLLVLLPSLLLRNATMLANANSSSLRKLLHVLHLLLWLELGDRLLGGFSKVFIHHGLLHLHLGLLGIISANLCRTYVL